MGEARSTYRKLQELGIKNQDARYVLPNATQTDIVLSANFRELRHIFCVRCDRHAQDEIRQVALAMLKLMRQKAPAVFGDFQISEETKTAYTPFPS